jgi:hypothetical protein
LRRGKGRVGEEGRTTVEKRWNMKRKSRCRRIYKKNRREKHNK